MSEHKKQHFIPQCYLGAWCDPDCPVEFTPYVWRFSTDGNEVKRKAPENIFHEKDMYTIHLEDGSRDLTLEHGLSQLESMFTDIRDKKIEKRLNLSFNDLVILCSFVAAMHARTKAQREHQRKQWSAPLKMMEGMIEQMKKASPKEKMRMASFSSYSRDNNPSFSYEDVKRIVENPTQTLLIPMVRTETPLLLRLNLAIFTTNNRTGFITSDAPCVWFDPKAYRRPPMMRAPALMYKTTEITLPISPDSLLYLNQHGISGYKEANNEVIDEINTRVRFYAKEYFVVNSNFKKDRWFDPGKKPEDSWENTQKRKELKTDNEK